MEAGYIHCKLDKEHNTCRIEAIESIAKINLETVEEMDNSKDYLKIKT